MNVYLSICVVSAILRVFVPVYVQFERLCIYVRECIYVYRLLHARRSTYVYSHETHAHELSTNTLNIHTHAYIH